MLKVPSFLIIISLSLSMWAHPKKIGNIKGDHIQLRTIGHSFSGSINNKIVMGHKKPGTFESELRIIEEDHETVSHFKPLEDESFGGDLILKRNKQLEKHSIRLVKLVREENKYIMSFDGQLVDVFVEADSFENGHFINPKYSMNYQGQLISFKVEEGLACYGYSLHLITMIMGAFVF